MSKKFEQERNLRGEYNQVFKKIKDFIAEKIFILNVCDEVEINGQEIEFEDYLDIQQQIRKYLVQNKLFIINTEVEGNKVVIETTSDIYNLLFVDEWDEEDITGEIEEYKQEVAEETTTEKNDSPCINSIKERAKITITENLAKECNYKNLRGLKMAISRKHGKGTYSENMEIDTIKLVTVIAKKADTEVIERLLSNANTILEGTETIVFNVKKELTESVKTSIKVGAFAGAITGMKIEKEELYHECITKNKNEYKERQDKLEKQIHEIQEQKDKINEINNVLSEMNSNLKIIDFVKIDKKMYLTHTMYLCGNGYFRKVYNEDLGCFVIKDKLNMNFFNCYEEGNDRNEAIKQLKDNKLYYMDIYGDNPDDEIIDITNFDDGIDYTKTELQIIEQLFAKRKLITKTDTVDWVDFSTEDGRVDFGVQDEYIYNLALGSYGQDLYIPWDFEYGFSLESAKDLLKQMKDKNYKKIIENVEYEIN